MRLLAASCSKVKPLPSGYFTIGSPRQEVLAAQGKPLEISDSEWHYGYSKVFFQNGRVSSWDNSLINPLRAAMLPENENVAEAARTRGHFQLGSAKDEVLALEGAPTSFNDTQWDYGYSRVWFHEGKVSNWYSDPGSRLHVSGGRPR